MVIWHNQLLSTLVELNFWWSYPSGGGFSSHSFSLPSGGDFSSPATVAVLICPLWWSISCGIVHSHSYHSAVV
jgi:hypothetical protein